MSNTYRLTTIKDIFDKVPMHRIGDCMKEITELMSQAKTTEAAMKGLSHSVTGDADNASCIFPEYLDWVDDGKGEIDMHVSINETDVGTLSTIV